MYINQDNLQRYTVGVLEDTETAVVPHVTGVISRPDDRRDSHGNPRELHIAKAIEVSSLCKPEAFTGNNGNTLAKCMYFTVEQYSVSGEIILPCDEECFRSVIVTDGNGTVEAGGAILDVKKGDSIFIPAQSGEYKISGNCEVIRSYV